MYENDGVQIFQDLDPQFGLRRALEHILKQPVTQYHPKLTDFYNYNVV